MSRHVLTAVAVAVFSFSVLGPPVQAQDNLGFAAYRTGKGVSPQDSAKAFRWYRLATEQGDASAQYFLGVAYGTGKGVPQDFAESRRWFRLAAEQGLASAQYALGFIYTDGVGVPQDDAEAARWWRLAAAQGHVGAQNNLDNLINMHRTGLGVPQYRLAAEQGVARAQYDLGRMYLTGEGVPRDYVEAHMWLNLAATNSISVVRERAVAERDRVAELMTPADLSEAQRRFQEWHAAH